MCSIEKTVINDENNTLFYEKSSKLIAIGLPMSVLKESDIFERIISIKYDVPNDKLSMIDDYKVAIDDFYTETMAEYA